MADNTGNAGIWYNVLGAALAVPGAKVNRKEFLTKEFGKYCTGTTVERIINKGTVQAGIEIALMDKIADDTINFHSGIAASLSVAAGIPGGLTMLGTIPADLAQYYYHVIAAAQKLAYIYGLMDMGLINDNFKSLVTLLIGVMANIESADKTVMEIYSVQATKDVVTMSAVKALDKTVLKTAVMLSYLLTGKTVFKSIWKAIPIIGGLVSGGITLATFLPMCGKLKERLHKSAETVSRDISLKVMK
jgi:hypothetical protein